MIEVMTYPETEVDYGIPPNMFGHVGDFYEIVGRVTMCAALLENRLAELVRTLDGQMTTPQDKHDGNHSNVLLPLVTKAIDGRTDRAAVDCREFVKRAESAFEARNHIVHNLWPSPAREKAFRLAGSTTPEEGWRRVGGGSS